MNKQAEEPKENFTMGMPGEYTIRHGEAPDYEPKKSITIDGVLGAPLQFLLGRGQLDETNIHMLVDSDNGSLKLTIGDTHPETTHVVSGKLNTDKNLKSFGINTENRWTVKDFTKFVRMMRYYFADEGECNALISGLQTFEGSVTKVFKEHNDNTGDSSYLLETKVDGIKMLRKFKLNIPLFKGYQKHKFSVEIGFDVSTSRTVSIYLFSDELYVIEPQIREELMNMELAKFADYKFAMVYVS